MTIRDGWLQGDQVSHYQTPNVYKLGQPLESRVTVLHLTAGPIEDAHNWWMSRASGVCAHVAILEDGSVRQYSSFRDRLAHVGVGWHPRHGWWPNNFSIGVELVNPGWLTIRDGHYYNWRGTQYSGAGVFEAQHPIDHTTWGWVPITPAQWAAGIEICRLLNAPEIMGHDQLSSRQIRQRAYDEGIWHELKPPKLDPGPAIDMEAFLDEVDVARVEVP